MALLDSEVIRIRYELGFNVLTLGAEPYIGVTQLFDQVVKPYTEAGASTTSSTSVTAATTPTLVTLTLASATGFTAGDRVIVDVAEKQETTTVRSVSGSTISVALSLAHSGTYGVTVEGGESIIRGILRKIQAITALGGSSGTLDTATAGAGIKKVDEIEFFGGAEDGANAGKTSIEMQQEMLAFWRDELASAIGCVNLRAVRSGGGSTLSAY